MISRPYFAGVRLYLLHFPRLERRAASQDLLCSETATVRRGNATACDAATSGNTEPYDAATSGNTEPYDAATSGNAATYDAATSGNATACDAATSGNATACAAVVVYYFAHVCLNSVLFEKKKNCQTRKTEEIWERFNFIATHFGSFLFVFWSGHRALSAVVNGVELRSE